MEVDVDAKQPPTPPIHIYCTREGSKLRHKDMQANEGEVVGKSMENCGGICANVPDIILTKEVS